MNLINFFLSLFRALLDSHAFAALDNRWCPYGRIVCYHVCDCSDFRCICRRAMMFLVSYIAIVG